MSTEKEPLVPEEIKKNSDIVIFNYKLLSQVSVGDKLRLNENGELSIDNRYSILRMFSGDNRYDVIKYISEMVSKTPTLKVIKAFLKQDMQQSLIGIKNLGITYINDETVQAHIELIIRNINVIIANL
jgi:hypothetical protein